MRVMRIPVLRNRRFHLPRYAPAFVEVVSGYDAALRIEETYVGLPDSTERWRELQDGMVSLPPHSQGNATEVAPKPMGGKVEVDETYVGGKPRKWRPVQKKQIVIGIRQRNGDLRMIRTDNTKAKTVREIVNANVGGHVEVILTDESMIYPYALNKFPTSKHKTINHSKEYAHGDVHTNTIESAFSLLKRGILGTWHKVSAKHLPAYLDEMCFRFNNRKNPYLFRDTILKLIQTPNLEYKELTAKVQDAA